MNCSLKAPFETLCQSTMLRGVLRSGACRSDEYNHGQF